MRSRGIELWLVRHGETTRSRDGRLAGWANVRLTARGREQAAALGPMLAGVAFSSVISSDLARAHSTARLAWGRPSLDARLREINFGDLEGLKWDQLAARWKAPLIRFRGFQAPGGESLADLRRRVHAALRGLPPGRHLLFTHGGVIRLLTRAAGEDGFLPTGSVAVIGWPRARMIMVHRSPAPVPPR